MAHLAINGGRPVRQHPFPDYVTIGDEEKRAVMEVLDSTVLSRFSMKSAQETISGSSSVRRMRRGLAQG